MNYYFHPEAEREFEYAVDYYETCRVGLGYDFAVEIFLTIERILTHPKAWVVLEQDIRRALVNRFPYGILYTVENEAIFIIAVMNLHRNPGYWKHRA